jgi:hypothetical protein
MKVRERRCTGSLQRSEFKIGIVSQDPGWKGPIEDPCPGSDRPRGELLNDVE